MMLQIISIYLVVDLFLILKVSTHLHNVDTFLLLYHHMIGYIKLQEHWLNDEAASEACREFIISCLNEVYLKPLNCAWIG